MRDSGMKKEEEGCWARKEFEETLLQDEQKRLSFANWVISK